MNLIKMYGNVTQNLQRIWYLDYLKEEMKGFQQSKQKIIYGLINNFNNIKYKWHILFNHLNF